MSRKLVLSTLDKFSFIDIYTVFMAFPSKSYYEINYREDQGELPYYRKELIKHKSLKKIPSILSLEEVFLKEFNSDIMRDYLYEELITYDYFRIENRVFQLLDEEIPPFKSFFNEYESLPEFSCEIINEEQLEHYPQNGIDFVIFQPVKDKIGIIPYQKTLLKI